MTVRAAILGATGVLGRHVLPRLVERGHEVRAIVRRDGEVEAMRRIGIDAAVGDILNPVTLPSAIKGCTVALHLATAVPRPGQSVDWSVNDRIRREGTANLIAACKQEGIRRYVQQSLAFLVGGSDGLVDETAPLLPPNEVTASAIEMEHHVIESGLDWTILRDGALYGPRAGRDEHWRALARAGQLRMPGSGSDYISLIHVADLAEAFALAAEQAPPHTILSIVDDKPVTYRELLTYLARQENGPDPAPGELSHLPSFRIDNSRAKRALRWHPYYRSYRSGFA